MKMRKELLILGFVLVFGVVLYTVGYSRLFPSRDQNTEGVCPVRIMNPEEKGNSGCCMDPPCAECFELVGSCNCDEMIAEGRTPCAECAKALNCES